MRKLAFFALAIVAVGCSTDPVGSSESNSPTLADPGVTSAQLRAFDSLQLETSRQWTWLQHDTHRTPMVLSASRTGTAMLVNGMTAEKATVAFLGQYKELFKMRDAQAELSLARSEVDPLANTHVRFQQVHHGVPVAGAELAAHYDSAGRLTSIVANYISGVDIDVQPQITARVGRAVAQDDVVSTMKIADPSLLQTTDGKLVVFADGRAPTLAYEYTIRAVFGNEPAIWITTVDAKTGEIIERYNNLQTIETTATGVTGDSKKIQVSTNGAGYVMNDVSRGVTINTYTAAGQQVGPGAGATPVTSTSLTSWDTASSGPGAAVDAHFYAGIVFDYYKKVHARSAIDGAGGTMLSTAHFGVAYDNAFWDGTGMSYGDGGQLFKPLSAGLDVVSHEFTHGVTQATSALVYKAQTGALNESVSDIFGCFIEHSLVPDPIKNWTMGEEIVKQGIGLRDMKNPAAGQQPSNMTLYVNTQQDAGGVHTNSGIPNNAAYLMTMGGTNPSSKIAVAFGIGWEKSEKVWYQANTKYFLSTTNFAQAAAGTMLAAKDVGLTENEQNIVDCAWKAVGVVTGACGTIVNPQTVPVPGGPRGGTPDGTPSGDPTTTPDPNTNPDGTPATDGTTTPTKKKGGLSTTTTSSGCSVGAQGSSDFGPVAGLLAAVLGLALSRRKRS